MTAAIDPHSCSDVDRSVSAALEVAIRACLV